MRVDPIENEPLYHFHPGAGVLRMPEHPERERVHVSLQLANDARDSIAISVHGSAR